MSKIDTGTSAGGRWMFPLSLRRTGRWPGGVLTGRLCRKGTQEAAHSERVHHTAGTKTFAVTYEEMISWEVHGEQRGMGYGLHLPRTSQVGNQVHQDDPVNEAVRDAFGVRDDNFTAKCGVQNLFSSGMMQLGNFSASWMRAIVLCIKVVINTQSYLF
ncbi:hypothetical protein K1719_025809 [Acacia pycnantha]|nr:hypothetical protein K1719_025809 [Acacia pycnantha]